MMSFSHDAHDMPPRGFFVNMASSSFSLLWPLDMNRSYRFLSYLSKSLRAFFVSFLSANCFVNALTISFILSINIFSRLWRASRSALELRLSYISLSHFANSFLSWSTSCCNWPILPIRSFKSASSPIVSLVS